MFAERMHIFAQLFAKVILRKNTIFRGCAIDVISAQYLYYL